MRQDTRDWFVRRGHDGRRWTPAELLAAKGPSSVSVVLPALDEEATVGQIVATLHSAVVDQVPLVDEIVVVDSGSSDQTAAVAAAAGARVVHAARVEPQLGHTRGKGEALWKSLFATSGELLVFIDADLSYVDSHYVTGLLGPLLLDPSVSMVKGFYDRPLVTDTGVSPDGGGRVTELVARPLLNLYWPALSGVVQPLSGEYAARRVLLERLPFPRGYGVEIGLLIDLLAATGVDGLAQVDLGTREHSHQSDRALAAMSASIIQTALRRLRVAPAATTLTQFHRPSHPDPADPQGRSDRSGVGSVPPVGAAMPQPSTTAVQMDERPPAASVPAYRCGRDRSTPRWTVAR